MAPFDDTTPETRFHSFRVHRTPYKKIGDHEIEVGILVPKDLKPGKHPLIVKFHGGGLITGDCLYPDWIAAFLIPLIHRNNAIVVLPNYRLTPEATGSDILQDLTDFWMWFNSPSLPSHLASQGHITSASDLDYGKVLVTGDSAGGYMSLMSALTQPKGSIKAVLAQYPMTYALRSKVAPTFFGIPSPGPEVADQHISSMQPGAIVSSAVPPERGGLSYSLGAYGRYLDFFGKEDKLWPIGKIEKAKWMPPTWIIHGSGDSVVDIADSQLFVENWEKSGVEGEVRLHVQPGAEHGFDIEMKEDEEAWLKEGLAWVGNNWLK